MSPETRPAKFCLWDDLWESWRRWLEAAAVTPLQACLNYALSFPEITRLVLGVDAVAQLQEILGAIGRPMPEVPQGLQSKDVRLINPSCWDAI